MILNVFWSIWDSMWTIAAQLRDALWEIVWWVMEESFYFLLNMAQGLLGTFMQDLTWLPDPTLVADVRHWVEVVNAWLPIDLVLSYVPLYLAFEGALLVFKIVRGALLWS